MISNLYVFIPSNSSHRERIETLYNKLTGKIKLSLSFKWSTLLLYAADQTQITDRVSEDGKTITLAEGRLQRGNRPFDDPKCWATPVPMSPNHADKPAQYCQYGEPFSLVFIRKETEEVWFIRDTFGLSTFYYAVVDDCIVFSPNIKDIIDVFPKLKRINPNTIGEYLLFNHIVGSNSIFADIKQIEVGTAVVVDSTGIKTRRVWGPRFISTDVSADDAITQIQNKLKEIVHEQFEIASSNTGLLLSGGIDSSLLCSYLAEIRTDLPTFSVEIPNYERNEKPYFTHVSQKYQTRHSTISVDNEQFARHLKRAIWHMEEPIPFTNSIPLMLACETAKLNDCDWLITGEGCDGVFSGGGRAIGILAANDGDSIEAKFRQIVLSYSVMAPDLVRSVLADTYEVDVSERLRILEHAAREQGTNNHENMLQTFHLRTYSEKAPRRMYRMSAASSVTCVSPFLTKVFADFLFAFPFQMRNHNGIAKYPMVNLAAKIFGERFANRPKDGFNIPIGRWFRSEKGLGGFKNLLLEERTMERQFYKREALKKALLFRLDDDRAPLDYLLWSVLNLELWIRIFIEGESIHDF